jgi:peptide/nickel transport system substrate-binding protein
VPGDRLVLERNEKYWRPIPSNIKTLQFRFFTDPEAMLNSALAGELDIVQFGQLKDAATLQDSGWNAYAAPTADFILLVLNYEGPNEILRNVNIRQAIARAIDRQTIVDTVFFGLVDPITIPMPRAHPVYDPDIAGAWDFDLEAAAEFVRLSGIENPTLELRSYANDPSNRLIAQIIQGDLAKIGITANITLMDPTTMVNDAIAGNFESNVYACSIGVPDVADFEDCSVYRHRTGPFSGEKTFPDFRDAYVAAAAVVDPEDRVEAFKGVFRVVQDRAWAIPICMRGQLFAERDNVSGVVYDAKTHLVYQEIVKG